MRRERTAGRERSAGREGTANPEGLAARAPSPGAPPTHEAFWLPRWAEREGEPRLGDWSAGWIGRLAGGLRARRSELADRSAGSILDAIARAGSRFLDPSDPLRREALELLPAASGLSAAMAEAVLDGMAAGWRREALEALVASELGSVERLDGPGTGAFPVGPRLCVQIVSGSVPGVGATALVRSLLVKGPTLLKPGRGDVTLSVLMARAIAEVDPELADGLAVLYWPGGSRDLERAAVAAADVVVAYGSDEAVRQVRDLTPVTRRFVAYHHRASVGVVGAPALDEDRIGETAEDVARSVVLFDQRGCVSPQIVWVEERERDAARRFAGRLAGALDALEERLPPGPLDPAEASAVQQLRGAAEMLAAAGSGHEVLYEPGRSWTVVYEPEARPLPACVGRVARVRPLPSVDDLPELLEPLGDHLQTVGIAGLEERADALAVALGRVGASRLAPFRAVPFPPAAWHHDGGRPLGDLVRWMDLEPG